MWRSKVLWSEGLFLRPQHLQQQERWFERLVTQRANGVQAFDWGFTALSIDLPSISSEVKLAFVEPSYSLASRYVSLFTFAAMVLFSIFYCLRSRVGRYE